MRFALVAGCLAVGLLASIAGNTAENTSPKSQKWQFAWNAPWVDKWLVREGYVPIVQGSNRYYCVLNKQPALGSRLNSPIFCGDADLIRVVFDKR